MYWELKQPWATWSTFEAGPAMCGVLDQMTSMDPFQSKLFYSVLEIMLYRHSRNSEGSNIPISSSSSDNFDIVQHNMTAQEAAIHSEKLYICVKNCGST